jgi:hypothetical protein
MIEFVEPGNGAGKITMKGHRRFPRVTENVRRIMDGHCLLRAGRTLSEAAENFLVNSCETESPHYLACNDDVDALRLHHRDDHGLR